MGLALDEGATAVLHGDVPVGAVVLRDGRGAAARGGLQTEKRLLTETTDHVNEVRFELIERGVAARGVAFVSPDPGQDLSKLAESEEVALVLMDGYRPLVGGVPRGDVGTVLREAHCDVAVLVARESMPVAPGPTAPVIVPFGGAEHDWAALELGAWIASATGAPLWLVGTRADQRSGRRDASRLLADASLAVQRVVEVDAAPLLADPDGRVDTVAGSGLVVIGISPRWRHEGIGAARRALVRAARPPVLLVHRGPRPGLLAPRESRTRFTWTLDA